MPPLPSSAPKRYRPATSVDEAGIAEPIPGTGQDIRRHYASPRKNGRMAPTRDEAVRLDETDLLAGLRDRFLLPDGVIYLLGNSLGALPRDAPAAFDRVVREEWGGRL